MGMGTRRSRVESNRQTGGEDVSWSLDEADAICYDVGHRFDRFLS